MVAGAPFGWSSSWHTYAVCPLLLTVGTVEQGCFACKRPLLEFCSDGNSIHRNVGSINTSSAFYVDVVYITSAHDHPSVDMSCAGV